MRYTSAVVLSTLAVGQAAAAHNRHASFHARREASKRDMNAVDWNALSYDLSDVDWDKVFSKTPAAVAQPTPTPVQEQPKPVAASPTPEAKKEAVTAAAVSSPKPAESSKAAEPSKGLIGDIIEDVGDLLAGVASVGAAIDAKMGVNDKKPNGGLWLGEDSAWGMEVTNTGADAVYYCWVKSGFEGMLLNVNAPAISVMIKSGKTVSISAAPGISGACAPATSSLGKSSFGGVKNTWAEFTYGDPSIKKVGAFNVSKNVNMKGCSITMKGKSCTSNDNQCVFECQDKSADSCTYGYELRNCSAENGGGGGWDPVMAGTGGGCNMPEKGERLEISFS